MARKSTFEHIVATISTKPAKTIKQANEELKIDRVRARIEKANQQREDLRKAIEEDQRWLIANACPYKRHDTIKVTNKDAGVSYLRVLMAVPYGLTTDPELVCVKIVAGREQKSRVRIVLNDQNRGRIEHSPLPTHTPRKKPIAKTALALLGEVVSSITNGGSIPKALRKKIADTLEEAGIE